MCAFRTKFILKLFLSKVNETIINKVYQNTFIGRLESQGAAGINRRLVQRCLSVSARGSQGHPASGQSRENTIIIITRPKPAYGRQGLAGSWGQDTDEMSTFLVFLTSHFASAALRSDLNQPGTIDDDKNPLGIMKTDLDP